MEEEEFMLSRASCLPLPPGGGSRSNSSSSSSSSSGEGAKVQGQKSRREEFY